MDNQETDGVVENAIVDRKEGKAKICVIIGSPASGKSYLIKSLLYRFCQLEPYFRFGSVFTASKFNGEYSYLPDQMVKNFTPDAVLAYTEVLQKARSQSSKPLAPNFLVIDDSQGLLSKLMYLPAFENFCNTHRHVNCSIFVLAQTMRGLGTYMRSTSNIAFMFNKNHREDIASLFNNFGAFFDSKREFTDIFKTATAEKYWSLVMINDRKSKEETYYSYKADEVPAHISLFDGLRKAQMKPAKTELPDLKKLLLP